MIKNNSSIIAVDDEAYMCEMYQRALGREGYQVETFQDPAEAVARLGKERFDLLLADVVMPGIDGRELIQKAKKLDPSMTIIVVTAHTTLGSIIDTIRSGAFDYLSKPFETKELLAKVKKALKPS